MDAALESRLRDMADREEIWQVLLRYARGLDRMDAELARSCYFDDAIEDHGRFIGAPDDFIAWADRVALMYRSTQHSITNHFCELDGENAWCETYYLFTGVSETPPHFLSTGRYIDHFQRRGGEWRIANRVCIVEGTFDLPDAAAAAALPPAYGPGETCPASRDRSDISYHRPPIPRRPR
ncbi:nuclear transport factor 2 family protein [Sphingobium sufflavum]|uniref:nuclear transport factor 2 family protein n=1 Tax=Sphingobium sufflavum TaxID=1129547 RepID=UPI001F48B4E6|nr:nuclear transport factor 2 family protein [Sphingobium sufflavum]MCE7796667.1 nuclear transport factor 2 family protein [Sphingobium sufflavum]